MLMNGEGKKTGRRQFAATYLYAEKDVDWKKKRNNICSQLGKNYDFREFYRITSGP